MLPSLIRVEPAIERWSPALFLLAGLLTFAVMVGGTVQRATSVVIPDIAYWPLFPFAFGLALVGLAGLYPRLVAQTSKAAKVGLGLALFGAITLLGGTGALVVVAPPGPYPGNLGILGAPFFLGLVAFVPAVGIYGISCLRTGTPSRRIGALLLVISLVQFVELFGALFVFPSANSVTAPSGSYILFERIVYGVIVMAMVTVGYSLRTDSTPDERADTVGTSA